MRDTNKPAFCRMTPIMHIHALQVLCFIPISQHLLCARPLLILADRNPVVHRSPLSLSLIRTLTLTHTQNLLSERHLQTCHNHGNPMLPWHKSCFANRNQ